MRRVLPVLFLLVLSLTLAINCSRQPQPHLGEWDVKSFKDTNRDTKTFDGDASFYFSEDGTAQIILEESSQFPDVRGGKYRFDYSKNPITLDIEWNKVQEDVSHLYGIAQFVGERKDKMQIVFSTKARPSSFQADEPSFWLTKKVKK